MIERWKIGERTEEGDIPREEIPIEDDAGKEWRGGERGNGAGEGIATEVERSEVREKGNGGKGARELVFFKG